MAVTTPQLQVFDNISDDSYFRISDGYYSDSSIDSDAGNAASIVWSAEEDAALMDAYDIVRDAPIISPIADINSPPVSVARNAVKAARERFADAHSESYSRLNDPGNRSAALRRLYSLLKKNRRHSRTGKTLPREILDYSPRFNTTGSRKSSFSSLGSDLSLTDKKLQFGEKWNGLSSPLFDSQDVTYAERSTSNVSLIDLSRRRSSAGRIMVRRTSNLKFELGPDIHE
ncbi:hypothetical protein CANCADRAFT_32443 [Tortispora caseinolytica NRRL Y-17796]|uniref:Uncharacterized protein n=1 Tax=Tortispora caseinolytica NRRL Y-17796 TaxID=767744 RepID=A0A1E4TBM9_9ASCO|nr:hypothetical protein CANCADRAFT_32443 [Tortispora caseinolytica NRRL Y-17796]